jgi:hypothetical protein
VATTEVERRNDVDVEEVPSAEWGWSKQNPRALQFGGVLAALFLLAMLHGNHNGRVEDLYLIGFAALVLLFVGRDWWLRRRGLLR